MTDEKPKRHANRQQRLALKAADVAIFVRQYGRKAQKGVEPNDRSYNSNVERRIGHGPAGAGSADAGRRGHDTARQRDAGPPQRSDPRWPPSK